MIEVTRKRDACARSPRSDGERVRVIGARFAGRRRFFTLPLRGRVGLKGRGGVNIRRFRRQDRQIPAKKSPPDATRRPHALPRGSADPIKGRVRSRPNQLKLAPMTLTISPQAGRRRRVFSSPPPSRPTLISVPMRLDPAMTKAGPRKYRHAQQIGSFQSPRSEYILNKALKISGFLPLPPPQLRLPCPGWSAPVLPCRCGAQSRAFCRAVWFST